MPFIIGATSPMAALAATAASIALPPCSRIATPARVPIGCSAATTPYCEMIMDRPCERSCAIAGLVAISAPVISAIHLRRMGGPHLCGDDLEWGTASARIILDDEVRLHLHRV